MAHYLSNVTLQKLDLRREAIPSSGDSDDNADEHLIGGGGWPVEANTPTRRMNPSPRADAGGMLTIRPDHDVNSYIRCVDAAVCHVLGNAGAPVHAAPLTGAPVPSGGGGRGGVGGAPQHVTWTAEQDGDLAIRRWSDGAPLATIERKNRVFVFAICVPKPSKVWAALSDGYIRVFDAGTLKLVDEFRAHCAGITNLLVLRAPRSQHYVAPSWTAAASQTPRGPPATFASPTNADSPHAYAENVRSGAGGVVVSGADVHVGGSHITIVASASCDWTVGLWDITTHQLLVRFSGHSNGVRCLAHLDGCILFSGGDDSSIRAWDLMARCEYRAGSKASSIGARYQDPTALTEANALFPVLNAHSGAAVTQVALAGAAAAGGSTTAQGRQTGETVYEKVLLVSTGHDGAVKIWNAVSGKFLFNLEVRPCGVTALLVEPLHRQLWVGGVDSVITVYDAKTLSHLTTKFDHSGSYVSGFRSMVGANATKIWTLDASGHFVQTIAGTDIVTGRHLDDAREADLHSVIDGLRDRMLTNYEQIVDLRHDYSILSARNDSRKRSIGSFTGHDQRLKERYYHNAVHFSTKHMQFRNAVLLSNWMAARSAEETRRRYVQKWYAIHFHIKQQRAKLLLTKGVTQLRVSNVKRRYLETLLIAAHKRQTFGKLQKFAFLFRQETSDKSLQQRYYQQWVRYLHLLRHRKSKALIARMVHMNCRQGLLTDYWTRLVTAASQGKTFDKKSAALSLLLRHTGKSLLSIYWVKWVAARPLLRANRSLNQTTLLFADRADRTILSDYYTRWLDYVQICRENAERKRLLAIEREKAAWLDVLQSNAAGMARQDVEAERARLLAQLEDADRDINELDRQVVDWQVEVDKLRQQYALRMSGNSIDPNATPAEQCVSVVSILKSRGVNCAADFDTLLRGKEVTTVAMQSKTAMLQRLAQPAAAPTRLVSGRLVSPPAPTRSNAPRLTIDEPFAYGMLRFKTAVFDFMRAEGFRNIPAAGTVVLRSADGQHEITPIQFHSSPASPGHVPSRPSASPGSSPLRGPPPTDVYRDGARQHWGLPLDAVARSKPKEFKELSRALKDLVIGYDMSVSAPVPPISEPAAVSHFRPFLLQEFNMNGHLIIGLAGIEYQRFLDGGLTAGDEYRKDASAGSRTPPSLSRTPTGTPRGSQPAAAGASAAAAMLVGRRQRSGSVKAPAPSAAPNTSPVPATAGARPRASSIKAPAHLPPPKTVVKPATSSATARPTVSPVARKSPPSAAKASPPPAASPGAGRAASPPAAAGTAAAASPDPSVAAKPRIGFKVGPPPAKGLGVTVGEVASGGPAEAAGLLTADVITRINGFVITDASACAAVISRHGKPGNTLTVEVRRGGASVTVKIPVATA